MFCCLRSLVAVANVCRSSNGPFFRLLKVRFNRQPFVLNKNNGVGSCNTQLPMFASSMAVLYSAYTENFLTIILDLMGPLSLTVERAFKYFKL